MPSRGFNIAVTCLLPVAWVTIRILTGLTGWIFIFYLMVGIITTLVVHGILTSLLRWETSVAGARWATTFYALAVACHLGSAFAFNDMGDMSDSFVSSPINDLVGHGDAIGYGLIGAWFVFAVLAGMTALVSKPERLRRR